MDVANSSMYDGPTAFAEAATMAAGQTRKKKVIVSKGVHYQAIEVLKSYCKAQGIEVVEVELDGHNSAVRTVATLQQPSRLRTTMETAASSLPSRRVNSTSEGTRRQATSVPTRR